MMALMQGGVIASFEIESNYHSEVYIKPKQNRTVAKNETAGTEIQTKEKVDKTQPKKKQQQRRDEIDIL